MRKRSWKSSYLLVLGAAASLHMLGCGGEAALEDQATAVQSTLSTDPGSRESGTGSRSQYVLSMNGTQLAKDFTGALNQSTTQVTYGPSRSTWPFYKMYKYGFNEGPITSTAFAGETEHFNVISYTGITPGGLAGLVGWWQPKIISLKASVQLDYDDALITRTEYDRKMEVLTGLQGIIDGPIKGLRGVFARYPGITDIVLDVR